jgi:hypothetical protein
MVGGSVRQDWGFFAVVDVKDCTVDLVCALVVVLLLVVYGTLGVVIFLYGESICSEKPLEIVLSRL